MLISIDVGYSQVKAVSSNGDKVSFPSVVAPARDIAGGLLSAQNYAVQQNNKNYYVGDAAARSLGKLSTMNREKPAEIHDLLVLTAAYLLGAGATYPTQQEPISLAVGLPLAFYRAQKEALKERLLSLCVEMQVDGQGKRHISFNEVCVYPQGLGTLFSIENMPSEGFIGLVNIGYLTTEYMLFAVDDEPIPVPDGCDSLDDIGVHLIHKEIESGFRAVTGASLLNQMYSSVLRGHPVPFNGKKIDLSKYFQRGKEETLRMITEGIRAAWLNRSEYLSITAFAGGGAEIFREMLPDTFPEAIVVPDPVFADANGYLSLLSAE